MASRPPLFRGVDEMSRSKAGFQVPFHESRVRGAKVCLESGSLDLRIPLVAVLEALATLAGSSEAPPDAARLVCEALQGAGLLGAGAGAVGVQALLASQASNRRAPPAQLQRDAPHFPAEINSELVGASLPSTTGDVEGAAKTIPAPVPRGACGWDIDMTKTGAGGSRSPRVGQATTPRTAARSGSTEDLITWRRDVGTTHGEVMTRDDVVAWSPDGGRLAIGGGSRPLRVWYGDGPEPDPSQSGSVATVSGSSLSTSVAWSPDGCTLAAGMLDKVVHLWREQLEGTSEAWSYAQGHRPLVPPEWVPLATLAGHTGAVTSVAWQPDARGEGSARLASGSADLSLRVWGREEDEDDSPWCELVVFRGHRETITAVAWDPEGDRLLSASGDGTVALWSMSSGDSMPVAQLANHTDSVTTASWYSGDGRAMILTASRDRSALVWEQTGSQGSRETWEVVGKLLGHTDSITSAAWSPIEEVVVTGSHDRTVRVWRSGGKECWEQTATLDEKGHTEKVTSVAWSPDGRKIVSGSADRVTRVWHQGSSGKWKPRRLGLGAVTKAMVPGKLSGTKKPHRQNSLVDWGRSSVASQPGADRDIFNGLVDKMAAPRAASAPRQKAPAARRDVTPQRR